jgi:hypothetical protein
VASEQARAIGADPQATCCVLGKITDVEFRLGIGAQADLADILLLKADYRPCAPLSHP